MQRNDRANHRRQVDDQRLIVRLYECRLDKVGRGYFGQQVENVLQLVDDLMIDGQVALDHLVQVGFDVIQTRVEAFQAIQLIR